MALKFSFNKLRTSIMGFLAGTDSAGASLETGEQAIYVPKFRQGFQVVNVGADVTLTAEDSGKIFVIYDVEGTSINAQSASAELTDGQQPWKHLVLVIDDTANQISIYLDNKLVTLDGTNDGDIGSTDLSTYASTRNMFIGSASNNGSRNLDFAGKISEWVLYSTALTASQVATLYNGREPYNHKEGIATGNLVGWWRMGDGTERSSGTTIYDMSANSNNGTMTNFPAGAFNGDTP